MRSVIVVRLVLLDVPGWAQLTPATRASNRLNQLLRVPEPPPLVIESAALLGLPVQFGSDGLNGPGAPEQYSYKQAGRHDQGRRLHGQRALRWVPPRRFVSLPWPARWASGKRVALR
jgi:hypothetical protein